MNLLAKLRYIHQRRRDLERDFAPAASFAELEESCIPSYCHANLLASYTSWWRIFVAMELTRAYAPPGAVLDFGAASGESRFLLPPGCDYHFVEQHEGLATHLLQAAPRARRQQLGDLPRGYYQVVLALDSLEHNDDPGAILAQLKSCLRADGVLILSGPSESLLYRLGRRIAGFSGHYHKKTIAEIHRAASAYFQPLRIVPGPMGLGLFVISAWAPCSAA